MKRKVNILGSIAIILAMACFVSLPASAGQQDQPIKADSDNAKKPSLRIVGYPDQIVKLQFELPDADSTIKAVNKAASPMDIDFIAIDIDGNEVARETVVLGPHLKEGFNLQGLFPDLPVSELSRIEIQSSIRPAGDDGFGIQAQLPVAFFSQRNSQWSGDQLGTCSNTTIGSAGCAISCIAMAGARSVYNFNPKTLNQYLKTVDRTTGRMIGYVNGCNVIWATPANKDGAGGFTYIGTGSITTASKLKSIIDGNRFAIAKSNRFSSGHFGIVIGYNGQGTNLSDFYYLDPWDTSAVFRRVNDGWLSTASSAQIYQ